MGECSPVTLRCGGPDRQASEIVTRLSKTERVAGGREPGDRVVRMTSAVENTTEVPPTRTGSDTIGVRNPTIGRRDRQRRDRRFPAVAGDGGGDVQCWRPPHRGRPENAQQAEVELTPEGDSTLTRYRAAVPGAVAPTTTASASTAPRRKPTNWYSPRREGRDGRIAAIGDARRAQSEMDASEVGGLFNRIVEPR